MYFTPRSLVPLGIAAAVFMAGGWFLLRPPLPPAQFTFANGTEIKSVDPHKVTGVPEHRIIEALFEGLTRQNPETLAPEPGVAERWEISDDQRVYRFYLREDARWSNRAADPVTAHDFVYSVRRILSPDTEAEYAYQAWYIENAKKYSLAGSGLEVGDRVEVELLEPPASALPFARGALVRGVLKRIDAIANQPDEERIFVVNVDGQERRYRPGASQDEGDLLACRHVLLDFDEVGVKAIDDSTLEMRLTAPTSYWLTMTANLPLFPVHQPCVETYGTPDWTRPEHIVSNGAFRLRARRIRDRIRLVKSDTYWDRDNVYLKVIDALAVESQTTALNLYLTGAVDWIDVTPPTVMREFLKPGAPPRDDLNPAPRLGTYYYMLNTQRPPLTDVRVRRALSMAINRAEITTKILGAGQLPAYSLVPPGLPEYTAPKCPPEDPNRARQLLAEAGFPDGQGFPRLEIHFNTNEAHRDVAELIRKQWQRELGIIVTARNEEWGSYLNTQRQMEYMVSRRAWIGDYLDPNTFLDMFVTGGENNKTGFGDPTYDAAIVEAGSELDPQRRWQLLQDAEQILLDEQPIIPIYFYVSSNLVAPYVYGFYNNLQDFHPLRALRIDRDATGPNDFMTTAP